MNGADEWSRSESVEEEIFDTLPALIPGFVCLFISKFILPSSQDREHLMLYQTNTVKKKNSNTKLYKRWKETKSLKKWVGISYLDLPYSWSQEKRGIELQVELQNCPSFPESREYEFLSMKDR